LSGKCAFGLALPFGCFAFLFFERPLGANISLLYIPFPVMDHGDKKQEEISELEFSWPEDLSA
jgi:hypothetical protein